MTPGPDRKTLLLADDHPLVLAALRDLLAADPRIEVVAACRDGAAALERIRSLRPDLALIDVGMPGRDGLDVLTTVRQEGLATEIMLLTASMTDTQLLAAVDAGAAGLAFKDCAPEELVAAIRTVLDGGRSLPRGLIAAASEREARRRERASSLAGVLTSREREVAAAVAAGRSNKQIARDLDVSEGTVKVHLHNIFEKLGLRNRTELATLALREPFAGG